MRAKLFCRIDAGTKDAFEGLCEHLGIGMSECIRGLVKKCVNDHEEALPDSLLLKAKVRGIKEDEKPYQQAMHLPNNFFEETRTLLTKRYPPLPEEEIRPRKLEPYKETIDLACEGDLKDRKFGQLEHTFRNYKRLHPETDTGDVESSIDAVIDYAVSIKIEEDMDSAKAFVKGMVNDGVVPDHARDLIFDNVREKSKKEWQAEWKEAVAPYTKDDEEAET